MTEENKTEEITSLEDIRDPEAFLKAYKKMKEDLVTLRSENKELKTQVDSTDEEAVNKWKERAVKAEAKNSLNGQGIKDADRILKYVSLDGVDFDEEGNLSGLDDKLEGIKTDFPELFDVKKRAGRNNADIHADSKVETPKSTTESQVERIFANRG